LSTQLLLTEAGLPDYLRERGIARGNHLVQVESAGDGNINWVRRARLGPAESVVVKQARPALERFPQYQASTERLVFESRYLELAAPFDEEDLCPRVLDFDEANRVLILEDLGDSERLDAALARQADVSDAACAIARFLGRIHRATAGDASLHERFRNEDMQRLHGEHIFALPYQENDFELPEQTAACADQLRADDALVSAAASAYQRYLTPEGALVHADVQPGNVLLTASGPKLLDAEIAHVGDPAFDVGTLLAHLVLPAAARGDAKPAAEVCSAVWSAYRQAHGPGHPTREATCRYAGLELLRRTVGAARVPAIESDAAGLRVVALGRELVTDPESVAFAAD